MKIASKCSIVIALAILAQPVKPTPPGERVVPETAYQGVVTIGGRRHRADLEAFIQLPRSRHTMAFEITSSRAPLQFLRPTAFAAAGVFDARAGGECVPSF